MRAKENATAHDRGEGKQSVVIVAEPAPIDKDLATLRAVAALAGWRLDRCGRHFVLHRWNRAIDCCDLDSVRGALARVGVPV